MQIYRSAGWLIVSAQHGMEPEPNHAGQLDWLARAIKAMATPAGRGAALAPARLGATQKYRRARQVRRVKVEVCSPEKGTGAARAALRRLLVTAIRRMCAEISFASFVSSLDKVTRASPRPQHQSLVWQRRVAIAT